MRSTEHIPAHSVLGGSSSVKSYYRKGAGFRPHPPQVLLCPFELQASARANPGYRWCPLLRILSEATPPSLPTSLKALSFPPGNGAGTSPCTYNFHSHPSQLPFFLIVLLYISMTILTPLSLISSSWPFVKNLLGILNLKADSKLIVTERKILGFKKKSGFELWFYSLLLSGLGQGTSALSAESSLLKRITTSSQWGKSEDREYLKWSHFNQATKIINIMKFRYEKRFYSCSN